MPQYTKSPSGPQCPRCHHPGPHTVGDGSGPHTARLLCGQCSRFLQWLSTQPPAARASKQESERRLWMQTQPVSERQRQYLVLLGYDGPAPQHKAEASDAIQYCLRRRGLES
jgi:hypothetical protein